MTYLTLAAQWLVPAFLLIIPVYGALHRVDVYSTFLEGAADGLKVVVRLVPALVAIFVSVNLFRESGALELLSSALHPIARRLGIDPSLVILAIMRPISGSGSLGMLKEILRSQGPDSFNGILASTIQGASDTAVYIIALYFSSIGVRRTRHSLVTAILASLAGFLGAVLICKISFH